MDQGKRVVAFDALDRRTVAPNTIAELQRNPNFRLIQGDILDRTALFEYMDGADAVIHLAAISAVDQSIKRPIEAVQTNAIGTLNVIEAARSVGVKRIHLVSTDEVFGHAIDDSFNESSQIAPRNPYAAGKAASEAIALAMGTTYGMEVTITNSANNYGPYQAPEKLIPRLTIRGIQGSSLPVYGDGRQVREWIHVDDHVSAIIHVLAHGISGERYCVGSNETTENISLVKVILNTLGLDEKYIEFVRDRAGHDIRYSVNSTKLRSTGWNSIHTFNESIVDTIEWYRDNPNWWNYYLSVYPDLVRKSA
jgi:dTDP-glucose 4,6-dehydratase